MDARSVIYGRFGWIFAGLGLVSLIVGFVLDMKYGLSTTRSVAFSVIYFVMLAILVRTRAVKLPPTVTVPFVSGFDVSAFAKAVGCTLLAGLWTYTGGRLVTAAAADTWLAAAAVFVPALLLGAVAILFLRRSYHPKRYDR